MNEERQQPDRTYYIELMRLDDIPEVSRLERRCFTNPWPESAYRRELRSPENNYYIVLRHRERLVPASEPFAEPRGRLSLLPLLKKQERQTVDPIIGFCGMWILYDESHITTIGIAPEYRGQGLGELLLLSLFDEALRRDCQWLTLEVRVSNRPAQALYEKYGFTRQGVRRRYYSDNGEDADIMWSASLHNPDYLRQIDELRKTLFARFANLDIKIETRQL